MARSFTTGGDRINSSSPVSTVTSNMGVSFWLNPAATDNAGHNLFYNGLDGTASGWGVSFTNVPPATLTLSLSGVAQVTISSTLPSGWFHLVLQRAAANWSAYVNNTSIPNFSSATPATISSGTYIGNDTADTAPVGTTMADVAVFETNLTALQVAGLVNGARPNSLGLGSALKAWWPLTGLQSPEPDLSGNANNGTVTGAAPAFGPPIMQFTPRWPQFMPSTPPPVAGTPGGGGNMIYRVRRDGWRWKRPPQKAAILRA